LSASVLSVSLNPSLSLIRYASALKAQRRLISSILCRRHLFLLLIILLLIIIIIIIIINIISLYHQYHHHHHHLPIIITIISHAPSSFFPQLFAWRRRHATKIVNKLSMTEFPIEPASDPLSLSIQIIILNIVNIAILALSFMIALRGNS